MASTSSLRMRRSAGQLHALAGVERQIRANDPNGRRRYLLDFSEAFRTYDSVLNPRNLPELIEEADVALIADYHALPASQYFAAALIESVAKITNRPIVVGVETIFSRDQLTLEDWFYKELEENELRERIRFDLDWGYEWKPFYSLLESARNHAEAIYGLDCMPREDLRKISARDRHAALKMAEIREAHPEALILIVFGESHLAPNHLPKLVREYLPKEHLISVLQNVDALYWRAAGETFDRVEAVQVSDDVVCVFNATPLEKYENYRLCLDRWSREGLGHPDLSPTIYNLIYGLLKFLSIHLYSPHNSTQPKFLVDSLPAVYGRVTDSKIRKLLTRRGLTKEEKKRTLHQVEELGCVYSPQINTFLIRDFHMVQAAEQAARFLHQACRGLPDRLLANSRERISRNRFGTAEKATAAAECTSEDTFYARAVEHALGYLGSRILYPARPPVREAELYELYDETSEDIEQRTCFRFHEFMQMVDFLTLHRGFELSPGRYSEPPKPIAEGLKYTAEKLDYVTRQLGYMLGSDLYDAYLEGRVTRRLLKDFFLQHMEEPGRARLIYFNLVKRARTVKRRARGAKA